MFSSFISSSNRRTLLALAICAVGMFSLDHWLYDRNGFTRLFGFRHLQGQVTSKVERGQTFAKVADVIFFGGSFIRYGVTYKPTYDRDVVAYNFGLNGGGPISSYLALKSIEPQLRARTDKPVAVLELVDVTTKKGVRDHWTELPFVNAFGLSRWQILGDFADYYAAFENNHPGQGTQLISRLIMPSFSYRQYVSDIIFNRGLFGPLWGYEDFIGYTPLDGIASEAARKLEKREPIPLKAYSTEKITFLRKFIDLANDIGLKVVLLSSPNIWLPADRPDQYGNLIKFLRGEYPDLGVLWNRDFGLTDGDFSDDGFYHLNIQGADKFTNAILDKLGIDSSKQEFQNKLDKTGHFVSLPPLQNWPELASITQSPEEYEIDTPDAMTIAKSNPIEVNGPGHYVLETVAEIDEGQIQVCLGQLIFKNQPGLIDRFNCQASSAYFPDKRIFVRFRPIANHIVVFLRATEKTKGKLFSLRLRKETPIVQLGFDPNDHFSSPLDSLRSWLLSIKYR